VEVHHIVPWETCREHTYDNLIALCPNCHTRVHRGDIDRKALRLYKANLRYTHDRFSQFEVDVLFQLYNAPPKHGLQFPPFMKLLLKRLIEAGYIHWKPPEKGKANFYGMEIAPAFLRIAAKGRDYVDSLGLHLVDY